MGPTRFPIVRARPDYATPPNSERCELGNDIIIAAFHEESRKKLKVDEKNNKGFMRGKKRTNKEPMKPYKASLVLLNILGIKAMVTNGCNQRLISRSPAV